MSWWGPTQRHQAYLSALSVFQSQGTDKVRASYGGFQGYFEKLQTEMAGGNAPDVFQIRGGPPPVDFIDRGVLLDLTPYLGNGLDIDDLEISVFDSVRYKGGVYEVPQGVGSTALYINTTVLESGGGTIPDGTTWTWDDFAALAKTVSDNTPEGIYGATDVWAPGEGAPAAFQVYVRQRGKELYAGDGHLGIEPADLADWLGFWQKLRDDGSVTPPDITAGSNASDGTSTLVTGQAAMFFSFTGILVGLQELTPDKLVPSLFPNGPDGARPGQNLEADGPIAISAQTKFVDEAVALVNFLINDPQAAELIGTANGVPISASRRATLRPNATGAEQLDFDYIDQVSAHSTALGIVPPAGANELENSVLQRVHEDVAFGRQTIDEGVQTFFAEADRLLG